MQCAILYEAPSDRCSAEVRGVVYKINPHNLSCMYKRMFETCATNSLRRISGDGLLEDACPYECQSGIDKFWAIPVRDNPEEGPSAENKESLKIDTTSKWPFEMLTGCNGRSYGKFNVEGWTTCPQVHLRGFGGYRRPNEYSEIFHKGRSQSASGLLGSIELDVSKMKLDQKNRQGRSSSVVSRCSNNKSTDIAARDTQSEGSGVHCGGLNSHYLNQIKYQFLHNLHPRDYTEKYREEYTYKRQEMLRPNNYDYRSYFPVLTVSSLRCYRSCNVVGHVQGAGLRAPARHQFARKKSPTRQRKAPESKVYQHMSGSQSSSSSPISVDSFVKPLPDHRNSSTSTLVSRNGMLSFQGACSHNYRNSEFTIHSISPFVCRSRPTIPSNAHGNIYPTSFETPTHNISVGVKTNTDI